MKFTHTIDTIDGKTVILVGHEPSGLSVQLTCTATKGIDKLRSRLEDQLQNMVVNWMVMDRNDMYINVTTVLMKSSSLLQKVKLIDRL